MPADNKEELINLDTEIKRVKDSERGKFTANSKHRNLPNGGKVFLLLVLVLALLIGGIFIWKALRTGNIQTGLQSKDNELVRNVLPALTLKPPQIVVQKAQEEEIDINSIEPTLNQDVLQEPQSQADIVRTRRLSSGLTDATNSSSELSSTSNIEQNQFNNNDSELQSKLEPLRLDPSVAGLIDDQDYLLTQGAMLDCQLETKMITTQPGMTSCYITRNVYSTNGRVILIDRGSKIVGNYQGSMQQGQARIFVLWSRIETPKGVIINLDSTGSGRLGEGGVGGAVDTHFWQRFGGAVMISLVDDLGQYAANQGKNTDSTKNNTIQFSNTTQGMQQAAAEALKNSINIPPTLYKHQGARVSIFVARDLDFKGVYRLEHQP